MITVMRVFEGGRAPTGEVVYRDGKLRVEGTELTLTQTGARVTSGDRDWSVQFPPL